VNAGKGPCLHDLAACALAVVGVLLLRAGRRLLVAVDSKLADLGGES
jgi:hypothetical protein